MKKFGWILVVAVLGVLWVLLEHFRGGTFFDSFPEDLPELGPSPVRIASPLPEWSRRYYWKTRFLPQEPGEESGSPGGRIRLLCHTRVSLAPLAEKAKAQGQAEFVSLFGKGAFLVEKEKALPVHGGPGEWVLEDVPAGRWALVSLEPEWAVRYPRVVEVLEGREQVIPVGMLPAGSIRIRVTDEQGNLLPGQPVLLFRSTAFYDHPFSWDSRFPLQAGGTTDEDGEILFEGLPRSQAFDVLAGNNKDFQMVWRKRFPPIGEWVDVALPAIPRMRLRVVDALTGEDIEEYTVYGAQGEAALAFSSLRFDSFPFPGPEPAARVEDMQAATTNREITQLFKVTGLRISGGTTFFVAALGYVPSSVFLEAVPPELLVNLFPLSHPGGIVRDQEGFPVPGARVRYRISKKSKESEQGETETDGEGFFQLPDLPRIPAEESFIFQMEARVPGHPEKGYAILKEIALGQYTWTETLDLVLLPHKDLEVAVIPGTDPRNAYFVSMKMTPSGGRVSCIWKPCHRNYRNDLYCRTGGDGTGTLKGVPRKGWGWLCVRGLENGRPGSSLGLFGPYDLSRLGPSVRLELPGEKEAAWLKIQLAGDAVQEVSVSIFPQSLPFGGETMDLPFRGEVRRFQVTPGAPAVLGPLFPGLHTVSVKGSVQEARDLYFAPGQILDLGVLPGKVEAPESAGAAEPGG